MKIAQVAAFWGPAYPTGSGIFCYEISKRLANKHEVHVFTSDVGNFDTHGIKDNYHLHPLKTFITLWDMNPIADVFSPLIRSDFDIVHIHSYIFFLSNLAALTKLLKRKQRHIIHFNGGLDFSSSKGHFHPGRIWTKEQIYDRTMGYLTTRLADRVMSASKNDVSIITRKFGVPNVDWIPNAVDAKKFTPHTQDTSPPVVAYVGKLEKWKGIDILAKGFELIYKQMQNVKFLVVGTGSLEYKLRELSLPIEFTGHVSYENMPDIYQRISVLLLPSFVEGLPLTCLEALSCGVPIVATNVGDTGTVVVEGKTGFLINPGDSEELASKTLQLLNNSTLRKKYAENGRTFIAENYDYDVITEKIERIYEDMVGID